MKSMAIAALMLQLTAAGGGGAHVQRTSERRDATAEDVGKHLSALKGELTSLSDQFKAARERRRLEAEQKKRETEEWQHGPRSTTPRAAAATGGSGASAR